MKPMPRESRLQLPPLNWEEGTLGQRLASIRKEQGLTQVELAKKIGIIQSIVSAYELNNLRLTAEMAIRFAKVLDVSTDELLGLETKEKNDFVKNRRVVRRLHQIDQLSKRDQEAVIRTIDAFLTKAK